MHHSSPSSYTRRIKRLTEMVKGYRGLSRIPNGLPGSVASNASTSKKQARSKAEYKFLSKSALCWFLTAPSSWTNAVDTVVPKSEVLVAA